MREVTWQQIRAFWTCGVTAPILTWWLVVGLRGEVKPLGWVAVVVLMLTVVHEIPIRTMRWIEGRKR